MSTGPSHSWAYSNHYVKLSQWIFEESWSISGRPIYFFNMSVPRDNPIHYAPNDATLQHEIYERITTMNRPGFTGEFLVQ